MPENLTKPFSEFATKHGVGAAWATALLAFVLWQSAAREKAAAAERQTSLLGLKQTVSAISQKIDSQGEKLGEIKTDLREIAVTVADHERRLTRREDNQYTAQDGAKVQIQVTEHGTILARHSEALAGMREALAKLTRAVDKLSAELETRE